MIYKNPWYDPRNSYSRTEFNADSKKIIDYHGFQIVKWTDIEFHVLQDGKLITMMAGINGAKNFIDKLS
jgi:hypothetical protein